jgi:hypothetical protein
MKHLSLKLQDSVLQEAEEVLATRQISRNAYFNEAILFYSRFQKRRLLGKQLRRESVMVAEDSLEVLKEMEN